MKQQFSKTILPAMISSILLLSGCGGSSDSDVQGGNLTSGIITGFGSIYVNGIKFETDDADFDVDDDVNADQSELRIGMHVTINGTINPDGLTGTAQKVIYDNELEGPVSAVDDTDPGNIVVTIMGLDITVNSDTTFDNDDNALSMTTLAVGQFLEVSGYTNSSGITATHIEQQSDSFVADVTEVEIRGTIFSLTDNQFSIRGLTVAYDSNTELDDVPADTLTEDMLVEVKGTLNAAGDLMTATKVEAEDDGYDDADEVELEGQIYNYDATAMTFSMQGVTVSTASTPELTPASLTLENDLKVEVEGELINGVLIAEEIKLKGRKIKIHAEISAKDATAGTVAFSLFGGTNNITVRVNQQTEIEDDVGPVEDITFEDLLVGDFVEVEAFDDGTEVINAIELERKEIDDTQIEGPISAYDATELTVTLFGQTFSLAGVDLEAEDSTDLTSDPAAFFALLGTGSFIELTDENGNTGPDAVIDKAEIEEEDDD